MNRENSMTSSLKHLALPLLIGGLLLGCKTDNATPISETKRITDGLTGKSWKAQKVQEGSLTVYQAGQAGSTAPGYQNYQLTFTGQKTKLTELTNDSFEGDWAISDVGNRTSLTLRNLTPLPTGTAGSMAFDVTSFTEAQLVLTATQANLKTGNTLNVYTLIPK